MKTLQRIRFFIAHQLDKTNRFCWADLAMFGMGHGLKHLFKIGGSGCKSESCTHHCETCYCGKFFKGRVSLPEDFKSEEIEGLPF